MYDRQLADALSALVPPLYYAWGGLPGDGLIFTREKPPEGAVPVNSADQIRTAIGQSDSMPATDISIHVFADRLSAAAFDRGATCADNALQGTIYHDPDTDLSFVALYDVENGDVNVSVHDERDLTPFSVEQLFQKVSVSQGGTDTYETEIGFIVVANPDVPDILCALRSLIEGLVTRVTVNFGAGGRVTYERPSEQSR
jgi:hypothetical protein